MSSYLAVDTLVVNFSFFHIQLLRRFLVSSYSFGEGPVIHSSLGFDVLAATCVLGSRIIEEFKILSLGLFINIRLVGQNYRYHGSVNVRKRATTVRRLT